MAGTGIVPGRPIERSLVLWFPDWPVTALRKEREVADAVALVHGNVVVACSAAARRAGVRRGQRRRDAQSRCPDLAVAAADPLRDQRVFSPVVSRVEEHAPGVQILRPGLCAVRARGPARYHGGENAAACLLLDALAEEEGLIGVRAGVADGVFTAEQAARSSAPEDPVRVVPAGACADFLAPLPVSVLGDEALADLLTRLGVRTLGGFAALGSERIAERFGPRGLLLHALAAGADSRPLVPRTPPPELEGEVSFEPALDQADQVAFGVRTAADAFIAGLGAHDLVCTELRVRLIGERGEHSERVWLHPGSFDAAAVVDRVRWQLAESAQNRVLRSGVGTVRLIPEAVDAAAAHQRPIFGTGSDRRVHHALSRVQAMLGHRGVVTAAIGGGRWLEERQRLIPWGDREAGGKDRSRPWPGSLPPPLPAAVYPTPRPAEVTGPAGSVVDVDERGTLIAPPERISVDGHERAIVSWAGPFTVDERGWDPARARRAHRFQLVDDEQGAWLVVCERGRWCIEAHYD